MKQMSLSLLSFLLALAGVLAPAGSLPAQPPEESPVIRLELTPARPPVPNLRFSLLPELREQVPGNGAVHYRKAGELFDKISRERTGLYELLERWSELSPSELPLDDVRKVLELFKEPLERIERATRSEYCDFELAQRLRDTGFMTLLREVDYLRPLSIVLVVKLRRELADDRPDLALQTLKMAYAMGRHVAEEPCLMCAGAGTHMTKQANQALELVLSHPRTPNLSGSLMALPRPFIDLRQPIQGERLAACSSFPGLLEVVNNPDAGPLKPEQIARVADSILRLERESRLRGTLLSLSGISDAVLIPFLRLMDMTGSDRMVNRVLLGRLIRDKHEVAKRALVAAGRPREQVEQWPHMQVAVMHVLLVYDQVLDEMVQWQAFPHWQSGEALEAVMKRELVLRRPGPNSPAIPLALLVHQWLDKFQLSRDWLERQFAALRVIEAIRLYAANHKGKLPATLEDIKEVPLPVCPLSGKSFVYRVESTRGYLESPPVPSSVDGSIKPLRYEITLRR